MFHGFPIIVAQREEDRAIKSLKNQVVPREDFCGLVTREKKKLLAKYFSSIFCPKDLQWGGPNFLLQSDKLPEG
jgi:hypothetical protein